MFQEENYTTSYFKTFERNLKIEVLFVCKYLLERPKKFFALHCDWGR